MQQNSGTFLTSEEANMRRRMDGETSLVMRMAKRNNLKIIAEILSLCRQPQTKTRVLYRTNLSWRMLQKYLHQTRSLGLLEVHHHSLDMYVTTPKGLKFLEKWRELVELL